MDVHHPDAGYVLDGNPDRVLLDVAVGDTPDADSPLVHGEVDQVNRCIGHFLQSLFNLRMQLAAVL